MVETRSLLLFFTAHSSKGQQFFDFGAAADVLC
jgi:hypothetical protein